MNIKFIDPAINYHVEDVEIAARFYIKRVVNVILCDSGVWSYNKSEPSTNNEARRKRRASY